jgi:methylenetetrahydrofolate--tRNA-(uracil-5-)-methyltransferase
MAGVEGYVESAALGYLVGVGVARRALGLPRVTPPPETAHGALLQHLQNADARHFQPMNVNYGLFPPLDREEATFVAPSGRRKKLRKREKNQKLAARALHALQEFSMQVAPSAAGASRPAPLFRSIDRASARPDSNRSEVA